MSITASNDSVHHSWVEVLKSLHVRQLPLVLTFPDQHKLVTGKLIEEMESLESVFEWRVCLRVNIPI